MSVLNPPPPPSDAERVAQQLVQQTRDTFQQLTSVFEMGAQMFWNNPRATPAEIAAALGTDGKEVFQLHAKLGALLAEIVPEKVAAAVSVVGPFTYNDDGSVAITETT